MARDIASTHHEKYDGSGYPHGLAGEQIPLCGRIVALADVYDALTSRRVYKAAMSHEQACRLILAQRGRHFDPDVVDAFLQAQEQFAVTAVQMRDEPAPKTPQETAAAGGDLAAMNSRVDHLSITDELTGLFNRRHAMVRLEEQWALAERYNRPFTIALIDIDGFERINDAFGHDAGAAVIRRVADHLRDIARGTDTLCRMAGEEFLMVFPSQTLEEAAVCAERCRAAIAASPVRAGAAEIAVTVTAGIAGRTPAMQHVPDVLRAAGELLHGGGNRVRVAGQSAVCANRRIDLSGPNPAAGGLAIVPLTGVLNR
jgi:diguanylate cyclase (GGDEF)-like protein